MTLDEAMALVEGLGYTITKTERRKTFRKAYTIYADFLGTTYLFELDKGDLYTKQVTEQRPRENTYQNQAPPQQNQQQSAGPVDASKTGDYKYNSFDQLNNTPDPFASSEPYDVSDDDLPF